MTNNTVFAKFNTDLNEIQVIFIITETIIGSVTVIGSAVVLLLYYHEYGQIIGTKNSHKYFISLAAADLIQGCISAPLAIYVSFGVRTNDTFCLESITFAVTTIFISLFLLVGMSVDRYLAITQPLKYVSSVTSGVTHAVIAGSWMGGVIVGVCLYYTADVSQNPEILCFVHTERTSLVFNIITAGFIVFPAILLFLFTYVRIYKVILRALDTSPNQTNKLLELGKIVVRRNTRKDLQTTNGGIKIREIRSTLILFLTIVIFLLSWVPGLILLIILRIFPNSSSLTGTLVVYTLTQLNSMMNPFLYARNIKNAGSIVKRWLSCGYLRTNNSNVMKNSSSS